MVIHRRRQRSRAGGVHVQIEGRAIDGNGGTIVIGNFGVVGGNHEGRIILASAVFRRSIAVICGSASVLFEGRAVCSNLTDRVRAGVSS